MKTVTKIVKILGREWTVVTTAPATGPQIYSVAPAATPAKSAFSGIRRALSFLAPVESGKVTCACGQTLSLSTASHQLYSERRPICAKCAGPAGQQLIEVYNTLQNGLQYSLPGGSVEAVK